MSDEILGRIQEWCEANPNLDFGPGDPPTVTLAGDQPLVMRIEPGAAGLHLVHNVPGHGPISRPLGTDPPRHAFMAAVYDLAGAVEQASTEAAARRAAAESAAAAAAAPAPAAAAPAQPQPAAVPVTFIPTHRVPASGMKAWAQPDPSQQPVADLAGGVDLRLDETQGAWARVTGSNGWTGWVDGRLLESAAAAAPAPAAAAPATARPATGLAALPFRLVPLIGAVVLAVAVFLPAVSFPFVTNNALDWPLDSAWSRNELLKRLFGVTEAGFLTIGLVLLVLAAAGLAVAAVKQIPVWAGRVAGGLGLLTLVGFAVSWIKFTTNEDYVEAAGDAIGRPLGSIGVFESMTDSLAIGFWLAVVGAVVLVIGQRSRA